MRTLRWERAQGPLAVGRVKAGNRRAPLEAQGGPPRCGGTGQASILAGVPFRMAARAGRAGGKKQGPEEEPLHAASSPCAPACPHLTPGLIYFPPFHTKKAISGRGSLSGWFHNLEPWCS